MNLPRENNQPQQKDQFLRSINIVLDANHFDRIAHFRPTRKSVSLIKALLGEVPLSGGEQRVGRSVVIGQLDQG